MHARTLLASLLLFSAPAFADTKEVAAQDTAFAFDLYAKLATTKGNVFFSPYSISSALGMTWAGARGKTADEMAKTLHFTDDTHAGFAALNKDLIGKKPGYQLSVANRLYAAQGFKLLAPFTTLVKDQYGAPIEQVDFTKEPTRERVNQWVEEQTNKRIKDLIPKGVFSVDTRLALVNAIYFKGTWAKQFDKKETTPRPFFTGNGKKLGVPMMFANFELGSGVRYAHTVDAHILELPYLGGDVTMIIVLPTMRGGLAALEKKLDAPTFEKWVKTLHPMEVDVWLPRFKLEQSLGLADTLRDLGMPSAFSAGTADFSGMTAGKELFISAVIHKAFVEVNEEGTEAAAATGAVMGIGSVTQTPSFRADHPFLFALRDAKSGSVLFLGRLVDPQ
jgi:serpin B